jgi:hypothetical protein
MLISALRDHLIEWKKTYCINFNSLAYSKLRRREEELEELWEKDGKHEKKYEVCKTET